MWAYRDRTSLISQHVRRAALAIALAGFVGWGLVSTGHSVLAVGLATLRALWLLPALIALHLLQLFLSAWAWQRLLPATYGLARAYKLRIVREGIDSLLPVAQIGGEIVGAQLLARDGLAASLAGASVVADVTVEFLTQLMFLLAGVAGLAMVSPEGAWQAWISVALLTACGAGGLLVAQRFGVLRLLEALARRIAVRWPGAGSLAGIDAAAATIYRRRGRLSQSFALHLLAWVLGSLESWAVLQAVGVPVGLADAVIIEALGMAARSAGFAVPGALVVQETGFALAVGALGYPDAAGLSLSLVKRVRETSVGLLGLLLWRLESKASLESH